jgi:hypothetical protein
MAVALLMACSGCDPHAGAPPVSGSLEEATVKGTVRLFGKPVTNGNIIFNCSNIRRPNAGVRQARINPDGTYSVKTLVDENYVSVDCKELQTPKNRMYMDNDRTFMVKRGENTFDFDIPEFAPPPKQQPTPGDRARRHER